MHFYSYFLLSGCKNFFNGDDFISSLQESISYDSASYTDVTIMAYSDYTKYISPSAGTYTDKYKVSDIIDISFEERAGYIFLNWIVDPEENVEFVNSDKTQQKVQIKITKPGAITITPNCKPSPQIVNTSPVYDVNGVLRDTKIIVNFDIGIDENAIYYSETEQNELENAGNTLLKDSENSKCYGYKNADGEIFFKNIQIRQFSESNTNYLEYYEAPTLDSNFHRILQIPVNKSNMPPSDEDIIVFISKNFGYKDTESSSFIHMDTDFTFTYRTNSVSDNNPPAFGKYDDDEKNMVVRVVPKNVQNPEYSTQWNSILTTSELSSTDILKINAASGKLWVRGLASDTQSGIAEIKWDIYKLDGKCTDVNNKNVYPQESGTVFNGLHGTLNCTLEANDLVAKISDCIDLSDTNIPEGYYQLVLTAVDKNENQIKKDFYFVYDNIPPLIGEMVYTSINKEKLKVGVQLGSNSVQMDKLIVIKDNIQKDYSVKNMLNGNLCEFPVTDYSAQNKVNLKVFDYAGNMSEKEVVESLESGSIFYADKTCSKNFYSFKTPVGIVIDMDEYQYETTTYDITVLALEMAPAGKRWSKFIDDIDDDYEDNLFLDSTTTEDDGYYNIKRLYFCTSCMYSSAYIWPYVKDKTNEDGIEWYVPSIQELEIFPDMFTPIEKTYSQLGKANPYTNGWYYSSTYVKHTGYGFSSISNNFYSRSISNSNTPSTYTCQVNIENAMLLSGTGKFCFMAHVNLE